MQTWNDKIYRERTIPALVFTSARLCRRSISVKNFFLACSSRLVPAAIVALSFPIDSSVLFPLFVYAFVCLGDVCTLSLSHMS